MRKHGSFCVSVTKNGNKSVTKKGKNLSHILQRVSARDILKEIFEIRNALYDLYGFYSINCMNTISRKGKVYT